MVDDPGEARPLARPLSKAARQHLYADSAGRCAFPGCPYENQLPDGITILEIAHIHAVSPGGPRFDPAMTAEPGSTG